MNTEFTNEKRTRKYGKRVGDRVKYTGYKGIISEGVVTSIKTTDNNRVFVLWDGKEEPSIFVAEYLEITKEV